MKCKHVKSGQQWVCFLNRTYRGYGLNEIDLVFEENLPFRIATGDVMELIDPVPELNGIARATLTVSSIVNTPQHCDMTLAVTEG